MPLVLIKVYALLTGRPPMECFWTWSFEVQAWNLGKKPCSPTTHAWDLPSRHGETELWTGHLSQLVTCHQRNRLSSVKGATPATLAFGYVPSEGGNSDKPGPELFVGLCWAQVMEVKQKAAQAFHSAKFDLAVWWAALARSRVEEDELMVGDYVYYKPQTRKLDPFRRRGFEMVVSVEASMDRLLDRSWELTGGSHKATAALRDCPWALRASEQAWLPSERAETFARATFGSSEASATSSEGYWHCRQGSISWRFSSARGDWSSRLRTWWGPSTWTSWTIDTNCKWTARTYCYGDHGGHCCWISCPRQDQSSAESQAASTSHWLLGSLSRQWENGIGIQNHWQDPSGWNGGQQGQRPRRPHWRHDWHPEGDQAKVGRTTSGHHELFTRGDRQTRWWTTSCSWWCERSSPWQALLRTSSSSCQLPLQWAQPTPGWIAWDISCPQVLPHRHPDLLWLWCLLELTMVSRSPNSLEQRKCAWWRLPKRTSWWRSWRVGCLPMRKGPSQRPSARPWFHGMRTMPGDPSRGRIALLEPLCQCDFSCATRRTSDMLESSCKDSSTRTSSRASWTRSHRRCQGLASTWWWHCLVSKDGSSPPWMWSLRFCSRTTSPRRWRSMVRLWWALSWHASSFGWDDGTSRTSGDADYEACLWWCQSTPAVERNNRSNRALIQEVKLWKHELDGCIYMSVRLAVDGDPPLRCSSTRATTTWWTVSSASTWMTSWLQVRACAAKKTHGSPMVNQLAMRRDCMSSCIASSLAVPTMATSKRSVGVRWHKPWTLPPSPLTCRSTSTRSSPSTSRKPKEDTAQQESNPEGTEPAPWSVGWTGMACQPDAAAFGSVSVSGSGCFFQCNRCWALGGEQNSDVRERDLWHSPGHPWSWTPRWDPVWDLQQCILEHKTWWFFSRWLAHLIGGSKPLPLTVVDWSSRKLTRICRSSLSAEVQTLAAAIDSLEWAWLLPTRSCLWTLLSLSLWSSSASTKSLDFSFSWQLSWCLRIPWASVLDAEKYMVSWLWLSPSRRLRERCRRLQRPERERWPTVDASRLGRFLSWWARAMTFGPTMWWSPAIEDYLTQSEIDRVLNGKEQAAQVPISAGDWNGISRQRRTKLIQVLKDTLLRVSHTKLCAALCRPKLKPCELNWQLCELWKVNYNLWGW